MSSDIEKTCAFTGHRQVGDDLDVVFLRKILTAFIDDGYSSFLCGMAAGFDIIAAELVLDLKKAYPEIRLIACVPCEGQSKYFSPDEKKRYENVLKNCDEERVLNTHYYKGCMQMRDRYMVDNSSLLIAYKRENRGGTYYTLKYALSLNKKICLL